jgi:hypothetical protein
MNVVAEVIVYQQFLANLAEIGRKRVAHTHDRHGLS